MTARRDLERFCKAMWLVPKFCWFAGRKTLFIYGPKDRYMRVADGKETFEQMAVTVLAELRAGAEGARDTLQSRRITREDIERMANEA